MVKLWDYVTEEMDSGQTGMYGSFGGNMYSKTYLSINFDETLKMRNIKYWFEGNSYENLLSGRKSGDLKTLAITTCWRNEGGAYLQKNTATVLNKIIHKHKFIQN